MIDPEQKIHCPVCNTPILFDVNQLLMGVQFGCPGCQASIGLAGESRQLVHNTIEKLDQLKSGAA